MLAALVLSTLLSTSPPGPAAVPLADAPAAWAPAVARAQEAGRAFQKALQARLGEALAQGGPPAAVDVCSKDAPRIAAETAAATGVKLGRTSERLRNPANATPAWATSALREASGRKGADVKPLVVDLGRSVGVLLPITAGQGCLGCHGAPETLKPAVKEALASRYPADRAVGYQEGDFRGFLWVEAPR